MKLTEINERYESILSSNETKEEKNRQLALLMTEMETYYQIPAIRNPEWEMENKAVIAMYRKLSRSRSLD